MKLEIDCAYCGKEKTLELDTDGFNPKKTVRQIIEGSGWLVQINDQNFDIYCSRGCAE